MYQSWWPWLPYIYSITNYKKCIIVCPYPVAKCRMRARCVLVTQPTAQPTKLSIFRDQYLNNRSVKFKICRSFHGILSALFIGQPRFSVGEGTVELWTKTCKVFVNFPFVAQILTCLPCSHRCRCLLQFGYGCRERDK